MEPWTVVLLILLAVLVGLLVPVLIQLRKTLKSAGDWLERLGPQVDGTLTEVQKAARRINDAGSGLEQSAKRAKSVLDVAGDIGQTLQKVNRSLRTAAVVGTAVGPAIAAAVRAFTEFGARPNPGTDGSGPPPEDTATPAPSGAADSSSEETKGEER
jgi:uncharacterized protein YoxC